MRSGELSGRRDTDLERYVRSYAAQAVQQANRDTRREWARDGFPRDYAARLLTLDIDRLNEVIGLQYGKWAMGVENDPAEWDAQVQDFVDEANDYMSENEWAIASGADGDGGVRPSGHALPHSDQLFVTPRGAHFHDE